MDKRSWLIWKLLSSFSFCLLVGCTSQQAIAEDINCNLAELTDHPVKACAMLFEKKLSSLTQKDKTKYVAAFQQLEVNKSMTRYEDYVYLFKKYPTPELLFSQLQLAEQIAKNTPNNKQVSYDSPECCAISEYTNTVNSYDIIISMLENKASVNQHEKDILQVSKQRSQCLHTFLDDLRDNPTLIIESSDIVNKCYKHWPLKLKVIK